MKQILIAHFSKKVIFLSLIFLLANLGVYSLRIASEPVQLESLAPKLLLSDSAEIDIKSPYDAEYRLAIAGQEIYSGTSIKTDKGEFAEIVLGANQIKLDESSEIELIENNIGGAPAYRPDAPDMVLLLKSGSVWVNASDRIEVRTQRMQADLHKALGILTYGGTINRVMMITGDANLDLLSAEGEKLSSFVVPLHNQVTFVDNQITDVYKALKPSKLKKELKMTAISEAVLADNWVSSNAYDFAMKKSLAKSELIDSPFKYALKSSIQKIKSALSFAAQAKRDIAVERVQTKFAYLLGAVQEENDLAKADELIVAAKKIIAKRNADPLMENLIVETLFEIENAPLSSPAYKLREALMDEVEDNEGVYVYRIYLTDLRKVLYEDKVREAESTLKKWQDRWTDTKIQEDLNEYDRQAQILNHTILSYIDSITLSILNNFDKTGENLIAYSDDKEETRFEVIQNRLQITASLVSKYQYVLAKQYLKNSYLSLNIEKDDSDLASTKIFLETGRLLAQRIEYAEDVLHGSAEPIDETLFREYFQNKTRDEAFVDDLRSFFELESAEQLELDFVEVPSSSDVAERFMLARINVNTSDIKLVPDAGFTYNITNARLMDRGQDGSTLSFDAIYDYASNSVADVLVGEKTYSGGFTLSDIVLLLRRGGNLTSEVHVPSSTSDDIDLFITDEERIKAMEGQLIAQDVARQLAFNDLTAQGISIANVKFDIQILDELNLDKFKVTNAVFEIKKDEPYIVSFEYNSSKNLASDIKNEEGVQLIEEVDLTELIKSVKERIDELEAQLKMITDFTAYAKQNNLYIYPDDIVYVDPGYLQMDGLELLTLGLQVDGLYDPESKKFVTVTNELLSSEDIDLKEYFEELAVLHLLAYLAEEGISVSEESMNPSYPFNSILLEKVTQKGDQFDLKLDPINKRFSSVKRLADSKEFGVMSFDEFKDIEPMPLPEPEPEPEPEPALESDSEEPLESEELEDVVVIDEYEGLELIEPIEELELDPEMPVEPETEPAPESTPEEPEEV